MSEPSESERRSSDENPAAMMLVIAGAVVLLLAVVGGAVAFTLVRRSATEREVAMVRAMEAEQLARLAAEEARLAEMDAKQAAEKAVRASAEGAAQGADGLASSPTAAPANKKSGASDTVPETDKALADAWSDLEQRDAELYRLRIQLAAQRLAAPKPDFTALLRDLELAPPQLRNFEWRLLVARAEQAEQAESGEAPEAANAETGVAAAPPSGTNSSGTNSSGANPLGAVTLFTRRLVPVRIPATDSVPAAAPANSPAEVRLLAVSPDGQRVTALDTSGALVTWDLHSGEQVARTTPDRLRDALWLGYHAGWPAALVPADSNKLALIQWDVERPGQISAELDGPARVALWTGAGPLAATSDSAARAFSLEAKTWGEPFDGGAAGCLALALGAGRLALAAEDRTVKIWDYASREPLADIHSPTPVLGLAISPDGTRLAAAGEDHVLRLYDTATGDELLTMPGHSGSVRCVAFTPDGTRLISGAADGSVLVWDCVSAEFRRRPLDAYVPPRGYVAVRATEAPKIDGDPSDAAWKSAPWSEPFVDIEGDLRLPPRHATAMKMMWDDKYLYVAAKIDEPHVWGTLTKHDSVIFHDNDFELFIDPDGDNHRYGEFEINALNTGWDLYLPKPYKDGGPADNGWEIPGLLTAVRVAGTLNDPRDIDEGWTLELALPWEVLGKLSDRPAPPRDGDQWRINFSRVEWQFTRRDGTYKKLPRRREDNWVWSPQGVIDMHRPEAWGVVQFTTSSEPDVAYRPDPSGPVRHLLHRAYYAQREYRTRHDRWAKSIEELGAAEWQADGQDGPLAMKLTGENDSGFEFRARVKGGPEWVMSSDGRIAPGE